MVASLRAVLPGQSGIHPGPIHGPQERLALRQLEELPLARAVPVMQRGQHPQGREAGAEIVPDVDADLQGWPAGKPRDGGEATYRLGQRVVRGALDVFPPLAEAGIGHVDQPRIDLAELAVADPPFPLQCAPTEVLYQDVALGHELLDQRLALRVVHIDGHVVLAVVLGEEGGETFFQ
jgi:hypothetical protein